MSAPSVTETFHRPAPSAVTYSSLGIRTPADLIQRLGYQSYIGKIPTPVYDMVKSLGYDAYKFDAKKHKGMFDIALMVFHKTKRVFLNDAESAPRMRFALAVAIGHICLHNDNIGVDTDNRSLLELGGGPSDKSIEANKFAVELLLPEQKLRETFEANTRDAFKTATLFDVPVSVLLVRLQNLGY
jgi:Zn-dependent peptidase ImmA (M78 family)